MKRIADMSLRRTMLRNSIAMAAALTLGAAAVPATAAVAFADEQAGAASTWQEAVQKGSELSPVATDDSKWAIAVDGERTYAGGSVGADASVTVNGSGWIIFDWKMDKGTNGDWNDKANVKLDGTQKYSIGANSSSDVAWKTVVIPVTGDGDHTVTWAYPDNSKGHDSLLCLDNVRFATEQTAVTATAGQNCSATATSGSDMVTQVDPGTKVTFTSAPADGYVTTGWFADAELTDQLSTAATYVVTVYDEPVTLYTASMKYFNGLGTEAEPYQIGTVADLNTLSDLVQKGNDFQGTYFALTANVRSNNALTAPIGTKATPFNGVFDGASKKFSYENKALFGYLGSNAVVKNLSLSDITIESEETYTGSLANVSNGTIQNVTADFIKVSSTKDRVGGLVGSMGAGAVIEDCDLRMYYVKSSYVSNTSGSVGGLVGEAAGGNGIIRGCLVRSFTTDNAVGVYTGSDCSNAGGIVGKAVSYSITISDCQALVNVEGKNYAGGIVGALSSSVTVKNCLYSGNVVANEKDAGGIVGNVSSTATLQNNVSLGTVTALGSGSFAGGIMGTSEGSTPTVSGNVSLVGEVNAGTAGRVLGQNKTNWSGNGATLSGNYGYAGTRLSGAVSSDSDAAGLNGAAVTADELTGSEVPAAFSSLPADSWEVAAGTLPKLKAAKPAAYAPAALPAYVGVSCAGLEASFKDASSVSPTTNNAANWTVSEDGTYGKATAGTKASIIVQGGGWLIFDWRMDAYDTTSSWNDKLQAKLTFDDSTSTKASLGANSSSCTTWTTQTVAVPAGKHVVTWATRDVSGIPNALCLRNVRYVTQKTAVNVAHDENVESVTVKVGSTEVTDGMVAPGDKVTVTVTTKNGYYLKGWKASAESQDFLSTASSYTFTATDEPVSLYAASYAPLKGQGTQESPYLIEGADDFNAFAQLVANGVTFQGEHLKLTASLDCSAAAINAVGGTFKGTFDGNGKTVSNYNGTDALFNTLGNDGVVQNLTMANAEVTSASGKAALLVASASGSSEQPAKILNCTVGGTLTATSTSTSGNAGALVASAVCAQIEDCSVDARVTRSNGKDTLSQVTGGVAGSISSTTVTRTSFVGTVQGDNASCMGGVAGTVNNSTMSQCFVQASLAGGRWVGGVMGYSSSKATIEDCLVQGFVFATQYAGGVAGNLTGGNSSSTLALAKNCIVLAEVTSNGTYAGGIVGQVDKGTVEGCYALQPSVSGTSQVARVGTALSAGSVEGCFGYRDMTVEGTASTGENADGTDFSGADLLSKDVFSGLSADAWTVASGALPVLKAVDASIQGGLPDYLVAQMNQAAADKVADQIGKLGEITLESAAKIESARAAYDALTDAQKALVSNYSTLTEAEEAYAKLVADHNAVEAVEARINALGTITLESAAQVQAARAAYDALDTDLKAQVSNYDVLQAAEERLKVLADDKAAAETVTKMIQEIGTVSLKSKDAIDAARAAYDALSDEQKALVGNVEVLTKAESTYQKLVTESKAKSVTLKGVTYVVSGANAKVSKVASNVTSVSVPATVKIGTTTRKVTSVGTKAFYGKTKLTKVTLGKYVTSIGRYAFQGCKSLKAAVLPSSIKTIGKQAFAKTGLTKLVLPKATLGEGVYRGCTKLAKVTVPKGVKSLPAKTFLGCKSIKSLTLPSTTYKIGSHALYGTSVKTLKVGSKKLTSARVKYALKGSKVTVVKVPASKVKAYKKVFAKKNSGKAVKVTRLS
ncbi:MAG: leucine-rich repeat protein [Coriobacteriia bacterium]|nr:leucine-rich repeat protein [Coriobacteriia bacterium]